MVLACTLFGRLHWLQRHSATSRKLPHMWMNLIYECAEEVENFKKNFRLRNLSVEFGYVRMSGWAADMKCRIVVRTPGWVLRNVYFLTQLRLSCEVLHNNLPCVFFLVSRVDDPVLPCKYWENGVVMTLRYLDVRLMQAYNLKVVPSQGRSKALQILALDCFKHFFPKSGGPSISFSDIWTRLTACKLYEQRRSIPAPNIFPSESLFQVPCHWIWPCYIRSWWLKLCLCAYDCKYVRH